jgi:hypothetical protein
VLCKKLRGLTEILDEAQFWNVWKNVKDGATEHKHEDVLNWMKHKEGANSWIVKCVSRATSKMDWNDWYSTSFDTNIAESAHAYSHRDGVRLTLVSAVQRGKLLDERFLVGKHAAKRGGIISKYSNHSITGRTASNLKRTKKAAIKKSKKDPVLQQQESILERAQSLVHDGVSIDVVDLFLKTEKQRQTSDNVS